MGFGRSPFCWWFLAAIPVATVVVITVLNHALLSPQTATGTPGLDFGTGSMFDQIATRYDTINRVLALRMDIGWRRQMTSRIKELLLLETTETSTTASSTTASAWRILDMATGTADVALQLVEDLSSSSSSSKGTVLGLDPSENMLSVGRSKIAERSLQDRIVLERADARDLSDYYDRTASDDQKFDAATMAFGIRNVVPNRETALCEIHKLLKRDGILAILEFSKPSYEKDGILGAAAGVFIDKVVPIVGSLLSGATQEYIHLQNSIKEFPSPEDFKQRLQTLECPLRNDHEDSYFYVGYYEMEEVRHMNFGSVQLYVGKAAVKPKPKIVSSSGDTKLPPIGGG
jgi:demethylmenaquinone methyltransferase/2-methoxy-6-polyprenyl-1,4-benzoquinol methylase